jgi:hypothetical protein
VRLGRNTSYLDRNFDKYQPHRHHTSYNTWQTSKPTCIVHNEHRHSGKPLPLLGHPARHAHGLLIPYLGMTRKEFQNLHLFHFPPVRVPGRWRAMNSTLTAMLGPGRTQHHCILVVRAHEDSQSPNLRSSSAMYPHWLRHRRSRSALSDQIGPIEASGHRSRTE